MRFSSIFLSLFLLFILFPLSYTLYVDLQRIDYLKKYDKWVLIEIPGYSSTFEERMNWQIDKNYADDLLIFLYECGDKDIFLFASGNFLENDTFMEYLSIIKPVWLLLIPYPYNDTNVIATVDKAVNLTAKYNVSIWFVPSLLSDPVGVADYIVSHNMTLHIDQPYLPEARMFIMEYPCGIEIYSSQYFGYAVYPNVKYILTGGNSIGKAYEKLKALERHADVFLFSLYSREPYVTYWDLIGKAVRHDNFANDIYELPDHEQLALWLYNIILKS